MKWFYDLKIGSKLLSSFIIVAVLAGVIGVVGVVNILRLSANEKSMFEDMLVPVAQFGKMSTAFQRVRVNLAKVLLTGNHASKEKYRAQITELSGEITRLTREVEKKCSNAEEKALLNEFEASRAVFRPIISRIIDYSIAGKNTEATVLYEGDAVAAALAEQAILDKLVQLTSRHAMETSRDNASTAHTAVLFNTVLAVLGVVLAVGLGLFISRIITRPLKEGVEFAAAVSAGDLTRRLEMNRRDEVGTLADALNGMVENLRDVITRMSTASDTVSSAAAQLCANSQQTATGTEEVAAQAGTVATAGEEMAATSMEIAQNCTMAADSSQKANDSAITGASIVRDTVAVMNRIAGKVKDSARTVEKLGRRSDEIGRIIGTIEEIADQTNLLALNAAIEAARAGEQGRGFAVVADEVRALAERTTKATKEIGEMIKAIQAETKGAVDTMEDGVKEVEKGTAEAARSGDALKDILEQISAVTMQVSQMATAAEQQTATTNEISSNIQQITEVINDTARGAEESASAANQLAKMAEELQEIATHFRLAG